MPIIGTFLFAAAAAAPDRVELPSPGLKFGRFNIISHAGEKGFSAQSHKRVLQSEETLFYSPPTTLTAAAAADAKVLLNLIYGT